MNSLKKENFYLIVLLSLTQECPVGTHREGAHMRSPTTIKILPISHLADAQKIVGHLPFLRVCIPNI